MDVHDLLTELMPGPARQLARKVQHMEPTTTALAEFVVVNADQTTDTVADITLVGDIGNATALMIAQSGDKVAKPVMIQMPTARSLDIVHAADIFERRGHTGNAWGCLEQGEHVLTIGGMDRFVGDLAIDYARAQSGGRGSDHRYSDGTIGEFLLAGIALAAPHARQTRTRLAAMLPIRLWSSYADRVRDSLRGRTDFAYNGRAITNTTTTVDVWREGEIGFYGLAKPPQGRAVCIDIGGQTVNVALFGNGTYVDGDTLDHLGVEEVFDSLDRGIERSHHRKLRPIERTELKASLRAEQPYSITTQTGTHRIDHTARDYFRVAAKTLVQELRRMFKMELADGGALFGGGAYDCFFGEVIREEFGFAVPDEPETINARGAFAKLAEMPAPKRVRRR